MEVVPGVGGAVTFVKSCSFGLFWDEISLTCVNSTQANCFNGTNNINLCFVLIRMFHVHKQNTYYSLCRFFSERTGLGTFTALLVSINVSFYQLIVYTALFVLFPDNKL